MKATKTNLDQDVILTAVGLGQTFNRRAYWEPQSCGHAMGHCPLCYPNGVLAKDYPRAAAARLCADLSAGRIPQCAICGMVFDVERPH